MALSNNNSERDQVLARFQEKREIMRGSQTPEGVAQKIEKPVDQQAALLDHLKTVSETPGVLTRADQRILSNVAEKSKLATDVDAEAERKANEEFKAKLLARRANKDKNVGITTPVEIDSMAPIVPIAKPIVAKVDKSGSTMLGEDLPAISPLTIPSAQTENAVINTPTTGAIMSETSAPISEIAVESAKVPESTATVTGPQVGEAPPPIVPIAEQLGVANVPLADVPAPETPVVAPVKPPIEVAAPPVVQEVTQPVASVSEVKVPEVALAPVAPIIEEKTAEIIPETPPVQPVTPTEETLAPKVLESNMPAENPPVTEAGAVASEAEPAKVPETPLPAETIIPTAEDVPAKTDTSTNHRNISSLPNDAPASAYANIGGGGVELPAEEEKKK